MKKQTKKAIDVSKIKAVLKKNLPWLVLFITLISFIVLTESVFNKEILQIDVLGHKYLIEHLRSDTITPIAKVITELASGLVLIFIAFTFILILKDKKIGVLVFSNLWLVAFLNLLLKNVLRRERPLKYQLINETGFSFPSGHSMVSIAFYGFLIYLIYKKIDNKYLKWFLIISLSLLIILIGLSRIYLGVHYTSDVLAGFLLGISYLIIYINVTKKFY